MKRHTMNQGTFPSQDRQAAAAGSVQSEQIPFPINWVRKLNWRINTLATLGLAMLVGLPAILPAQPPGRANQVSRGPQRYPGGPTTVDYEGFTIPKYDIMVAATEIGRLEQVNVQVGDNVRAGEMIAKLEDGLQLEAVATAKWRAQMSGETNAAKAETSLMLLRLEQLQALADKDIARPDELKRAIADWEIAKARELASIEQGKLRQLELSRYQLQLQRRKVLAPMDGVVAELFHAPGEYITPADPAVIRLVVLDQLYGVFNIPIEDMNAFHVGKSVSVFLSSTSQSMPGEIVSIAPDIDGESGTVKLKVLLDNADGKLRSGDRCRMTPAKLQSSMPARKSNLASRKPIRIGVSSQREVSGIR